MIEFNIKDYEFSHGKAPRGFGSWAFFPTREQHIDTAFWVHQSTYGDAKKEAQIWARNFGHSTVYVGS